MRKAAIDVGSNSVLLLVAEKVDGNWTTLHEDTSVTALGEGTKATGLLGQAGISSTLATLAKFYDAARSHGAVEIVAGATMAARMAANTPDFLAAAEAQGTPVFVLSGNAEAELGFRCVVDDPLFNGEERIAVIDPGGHSTELVTAERTGQDWHISFRRSFPVGTLGLRSSIFPNERVGALEILRGVSFLDDSIGMAFRPGSVGRAIVLGASGTNLVSIREALAHWDPERVHGARLGYEEVSRMFGTLAPMTDAERAAVPGMEKGRERTIHLGALILERFIHALRMDEVSVSVRGWRHAILDVPDLQLTSMKEEFSSPSTKR